MPSVLIVDDHAGFRRTARTLLESEGYDVVGEAGSVAEAIELVERLRPDVILLDVQLPDGDGFEVANRVRCNGDCPVVVLTSSRDASEYGNLVGACGAKGFVPKGELSGGRLAALLG